MTIRKKDGNLYVLEGPNPIVSGQVSWEASDLVFHNFSWEEISFSQISKARKPEQKRPATTTTQDPSPKIPDELQAQPSEALAEKEGSEDAHRDFDLPYIKHKVLCHCLPATTKIHTDKLYGESWQRTTYGKKFVFPCVVIQSSDIIFEFWTSDPNRQIHEKSIIYPFSYEVHNKVTDSYDRVPYDEYRWWKVSDRTEKEGGWLLTCVPSEDQPDFSD